MRVSDRLTHPKRSQDLAVSDDEMTELQRAFDWFTECTHDVMQLGLEALTKDVKSKMTNGQAAQLDGVLEAIDQSS